MNFSEMKDRLLSGLGKAADAGKDIANKAADKAKAGTRIAKLTMEISSEKENMKKAYLEIGKLYYDTHKDDPEGLFIQLCEEIGLAQKNIADKEAEIDTLKAGGESDDLGDDLDDIVSKEEKAVSDFVDKAGDKAEEIKDTAGETFEEVKDLAEDKMDDLKEKAEEIKEAVEDKVEEIKDKIEDVIDDIKK